MSDNIYKNNVYSRKIKMWHSKGRVGDGDETAVQVYSQMEQVEFRRVPFTLQIGDKEIQNNVFGIVRMEGNKVKLIGNTKDRYVLRQPIEYIKKFDSAIRKPVETVGFLGSNADKLFITWTLPEIDIHGDPIEMYGLLSFGFDGKYGNHLFITSVRTVCENTHNLAVADAAETENHGRGKNNNNAVVTTKHNQKDHLDVLGYWMTYVDSEAERQVQMMKSLFCKMEEKPLSLDEAYGFFSKVYPYPENARTFIPPELVKKETEHYDADKVDADKHRDILMSLFDGEGIAINKTVFGAYNCVTEFQNHRVMAKKNDGTDSILIGNRSKVMSEAFSIARDYVSN